MQRVYIHVHIYVCMYTYIRDHHQVITDSDRQKLMMDDADGGDVLMGDRKVGGGSPASITSNGYLSRHQNGSYTFGHK